MIQYARFLEATPRDEGKGEIGAWPHCHIRCNVQDGEDCVQVLVLDSDLASSGLLTTQHTTNDRKVAEGVALLLAVFLVVFEAE